jgi:hypothetical protein
MHSIGANPSAPYFAQTLFGPQEGGVVPAAEQSAQVATYLQTPAAVSHPPMKHATASPAHDAAEHACPTIGDTWQVESTPQYVP